MRFAFIVGLAYFMLVNIMTSNIMYLNGFPEITDLCYVCFFNMSARGIFDLCCR